MCVQQCSNAVAGTAKSRVAHRNSGNRFEFGRAWDHPPSRVQSLHAFQLINKYTLLIITGISKLLFAFVCVCRHYISTKSRTCGPIRGPRSLMNGTHMRSMASSATMLETQRHLSCVWMAACALQKPHHHAHTARKKACHIKVDINGATGGVNWMQKKKEKKGVFVSLGRNLRLAYAVSGTSHL